MKLKRQKSGIGQVEKYLIQAFRKLNSANKNLGFDPEASYQLAYEAMLKGSLGLMLSRGVRPRSMPGHHKVVVDFVAKFLPQNAKGLILVFDKMRRRRNQVIYEVDIYISKTEARKVLEVAGEFLRVLAKVLKIDDKQVRMF